MIRIRRLAIRVGAARRSDALLLARLAGEAMGPRLSGCTPAAPAADVEVRGGGRTAPILARDIGHSAAAAVGGRKE